MIRITINGIEINPANIDGAEGVSFVYRSRDGDGPAFSFSPELRARGAAFLLLESIFLCDAGAATKSAAVEVFDLCCTTEENPSGLIFEGRIDGSDLSWCTLPTCYADFSIIDNSSAAAALECLKNTIIWSDGDGATAGEDTARPARYVPYCIDMRPPILQDFVLSLGILVRAILAPVIFAFASIIGVINLLISAVNLIPLVDIPLIDFDGNDDTNIFNEAAALISLISEYTIGCGRSHKAPFVHSYLSNLCENCGLSLSSSLFEPGGPYYDLMRLDAGRVKGRREAADIEAAFLENRPNLNGIQFLEELAAFNIAWKIEGGVLKIERPPDFEGPPWFSLSDIPSDRIIELCFDVSDQKSPAFAEYTYQIDGIDRAGDETNKRYTETVINWNDPPSPALSGLFEKTLQYGTPQFRGDALRPDVSPLDRPFYSSAIGFPQILGEYQNALLMSQGTAALPKLLLWDGNDLPDRRGLVLRYDAGGGVWHYQPEMYIYNDLSEIPPSAPAGINTLYQNLFFSDDPRETETRRRSFTLRITYDCKTKTEAAVSIGRLLVLPYCGGEALGEIEEIEIDAAGLEMVIKGKI